MSNFIKELVNAFNLNNYACGRINTNFTVEGNKIVGLFKYGTDVARYLRGIGKEIIKRHCITEEKASRYYNLNYFPFVLNNEEEKYISKDVKKVKLADSTNKEVIRNFQIHFANEFERAVILKVIACLQKEVKITEEEAREWIRGTVKTGAIGEFNPLRKRYLYCIAFSDEYFKREGYDSEAFESFKEAYIQEFNSRLKECNLKKSDFYEDKDGVLYIKNISDKVIENVVKYVKKEVAFDFKTPGTEDSKVENFKDVLSSLISKQIEKPIDFYDYDVFTDKRKIKSGNNFVLIPLTKTCDGRLEFLKHNDRYKINAKYTNLASDIMGKTEKTCSTNYGNPVYAISNKGIAQLLPEIVKFPIAYNGRTGHFEFAADLGPSSRIGSESPRHASSVSSPVPLPQLQPGTEGAVVVVPAADAKNNPDPSMSGQNPDEGYDYMQDSVNTRNLSDAERIRKRRNSGGRNLSADSALSSEFDASRPSSGIGMMDDSGVYSSQELPTSDPEGPIGPLPVRVVENPQNPVYTCVIESFRDSSEFDTMKSDGKHKLNRDCSSRASSRSASSLSSSTSDTSVGTVIGIDSSSESSSSRGASSEPFAAPSSSMGGVCVDKRRLVKVRE
ncbi:hypothetical protein [Wolbachia pipientis]|uniref:hypothetical protein n=1 Tax=Wolbachia pipientis TaxID=955 RepID=UPI0020304565|nr:hypothetical protein [Wolbachia pipientis]MCM1001861.1 hypothetical protein [Wolbachia pipientis]